MCIFRLIAFIGVGCFLIGLSYVIVLRASLAIWNSSLNPFHRPGIGLDPNSASFFAASLMIMPYMIGGIFLGLFRRARYALSIDLLTTLSERLLIFAVAAYVLGRFRQVTETGEVYYVEGGSSIIEMIRSEALPYFDRSYILLGVPKSILILYLVAYRIEKLRSRQIVAGH